MEGISRAKGEDRRGYEVKVTKEDVLYLYRNDIEPFVEFRHRLGFQAIVVNSLLPVEKLGFEGKRT